MEAIERRRYEQSATVLLKSKAVLRGDRVVALRYPRVSAAACPLLVEGHR